MKTIAYLTGALVIGVFATGTGAAQTEELKGAAAPQTVKPTPGKYAIGQNPDYDEVTRVLEEQGFEVIGYEFDDRRIEVHGLTATGHCLELKFNPATGKEVRREREDDCRPDRNGFDD